VSSNPHLKIHAPRFVRGQSIRQRPPCPSPKPDRQNDIDFSRI